MNGSRYYRVRVAGAKYGVGFGCPHHPKWDEVNLAATLPGWSQFPPAQRWIDQQEFDSFLSKFGSAAGADRARLFEDFLRWREHSGGG
jgi:hypothetical protein